MDWKLTAASFAIVFLAELGDKTQLAALALSSRSSQGWPVFLGASLALVLATGIGVLAGSLLAHWLPERAVEIGSALLFIAVGAALLIKSFFF